MAGEGGVDNCLRGIKRSFGWVDWYEGKGDESVSLNT